MDWLDRANQKLTDARAREAAVVEHESEIYESLWAEIKQHVDAARAKGFPDLFTNGNPLSRVVGRSPADPARMIVALSKSDHEITAMYESGFMIAAKFQIGVCRDGVVCLKLEGKEISLKEAAIHILWPFLFPELGPYPGKGPQAF